MARKPRRPRDPNQLAAMIVAISTGQVEDKDPNAGKNPAAVALGKRGGKASAKVRNLSKDELSDIGKKGALARWKDHKKKTKKQPSKSSSVPARQKKIRIVVEAPEDKS